MASDEQAPDLAEEDRIRAIEKSQAQRNGQRRLKSLARRNSRRRKNY